MTELQIANIFQAAVVLVVCSYVVFKIWPTVRVDSFRQRIFGLRDDMFDFAAEGNIGFDDPAYVLLRYQMNALIRYGHQLTLFRGVMTAAVTRVSSVNQTTSWHRDWEKALADIQNDTVRSKMKAFHEKGMMIATVYLILGSPVLFAVLLFAALCMLIQGARMGIKQLLKAASAKVLSPVDQRILEEAAVVEFA